MAANSIETAPPVLEMPVAAASPALIQGQVEGLSRLAALELADGSVFYGFSFGAEESVAGELVFQTGMVGYPESITDPSYEGQILVVTFPIVGSYGVPSRAEMDELSRTITAHFESSRIHVKALVVSTYAREFSHFLAQSSLAQWLHEQKVPAIFGVDTRAITKRIRSKGSMLGKLLMSKPGLVASTVLRQAPRRDNWRASFIDTDWSDPNVANLVEQVSIKEPLLLEPLADAKSLRTGPSGKPLRILAIDVGLKTNQLRCFLRRGVEVLLVPWNHDISKESYDGLFVSNGPGNPAQLSAVVASLRKAIESEKTPIFGICLGHQLLALAAGAETKKMKFGNRGHNIPCTNLLNGRCYITSQNHGFEVDAETLPDNWKELFVNANDGSNEGIYHTSLPYFSVQFHPEANPGPRDTEFMFDTFLDNVQKSAAKGKLVPFEMPGANDPNNNALQNKRVPVKKVLVLGSGGLSIGQAGEFDYSGSQAIKALKEEGIYTVLINPNIATIQTSKGLADKVYFLPVNPEFVRKVIKYERPDGIYVTFGGQTALNVGIKLKDEFESLGVKVLGTPIDTIITTEDREFFARSMEEINEKCAQSASASTIEEAKAAVADIGFPVIVRAAYALGGLGSGFANNEKELVDLCNVAFATSPQVLVEKSMKGWKEIEYEVVRDINDNCITVCNMENFDPLGIHTGDSIVVAPSQTLSDADYNMLRDTAVSVIRHLGVVGECNIQYALNPFSKEYCIIEVNARLSRSSALASKATGYPLAFIAAKLGLGIPLNEIRNSVTKTTCACFEPSLDYVVVKIPRWDLKKFTRVRTELNSSMKSVGEVMSIGRTFEEAIQKAIRAIDYSNLGFNQTDALMSIEQELQTPSDQRLFAIANAMASGYSVDKIWKMTNIDKWFLSRLSGIIELSRCIEKFSISSLPVSILHQAKQLGFSDRQLARFLDSNEVAVRRLRLENGIKPCVKQIDTVAAEFPAYTNYLYTTYNGVENDVSSGDSGVMVLGSGVYRIGSSVEFDWCAVRAVRTLREQKFKTIMVNYNPETVSTDYDEVDRLYFENINLETVLDIYDIENSSGVIVSMGGQTPNNIALSLFQQNVNILGTSPEMIDTAENRYKFSRMLDALGVDQPAWKELTSIEDAYEFCDRVSYPVLVRPSYVLSGAAMNTVYSKDDLASYLKQAVAVNKDHPVVISKYIENAKEIEMDAVARDGQLIAHFISEHVENAGVHSGDATLIHPPQDLDPETIARIEEATAKIGNALNVTGPFNIQFIAKNNEIKVIECNVRAARSFPFVSKVEGIDLIEMATKAIVGVPVTPYPEQTIPKEFVGVKVPQFSFSRLSGADPVSGVEMASTGEVACFGRNKYEAYLKALISSNMRLPKKNILFSVGSFKDKIEILPSVRKLHQQGYNLFATSGTSDFFQEHGIPCKYLETLNGTEDEQKSEYSLTQHLANNLIDMFINLPSNNRFRRPANYVSDGYRSRRMAIDYSVPLVTNIKCAKLMIEAITRGFSLEVSPVDFQTSSTTVLFPGFVALDTILPDITSNAKENFFQVSKALLSSGFTHSVISPSGLNASAKEAAQLQQISKDVSGNSSVDFSLTIAADDSGVRNVSMARQNAAALSISLASHIGDAALSVSLLPEYFSSWPQNKPIIAVAGPDLASTLLMASLQNRKIHVSGVTRRSELDIIRLSKSRGLNITCDVSVFALFLSTKDFAHSKCLPSHADQTALWDNMSVIDCFSIGAIPQLLAQEQNRSVPAAFGIDMVMPLLFNAVASGVLTVEEVQEKIHTNPSKIFGIEPKSDNFVEVEIDRVVSHVGSKESWTPFGDVSLAGYVQRVVFHGETMYLDGEQRSQRLLGEDCSSTIVSDLSAAKPAGASEPAKAAPAQLQVATPAARQRRPTITSPSGPAQAIAPLLEPFHGPTVPLGPQQQQLQQMRALTALVSNTVFYRKNIISVKQFTRNDLHLLFRVASEMRTMVNRYGVLDICQGRVLMTMFFEPSTRTSASFDTAMQRLGGRVVAITASASSAKKGESLSDTIRTLECYGDGIVLRHPSEDSAKIAAQHSRVPVINGGNGSLEHPTQAFLDLYTIREELGTLNGLSVTFLGDLKYGRTVHSLVRLLCMHENVHLNFVAPTQLALPQEVKEDIVRSGLTFSEYTELHESVMAESDVLYCTRVQGERFASVEEYESLKNSFRVDNEILNHAKKRMVVMHPLPRNREIAEELDLDPRVAMFRAMRYGLFVRMALLAMVMGPTAV